MTRLLTALVAAVFACAAQAQSAPTDMQKSADETTTVITPAKLGCLKETGTHIKNHNKDACLASPGRSYTREDLAKTGGVDLADSLRRLSPSISVHN